MNYFQTDRLYRVKKKIAPVHSPCLVREDVEILKDRNEQRKTAGAYVV